MQSTQALRSSSTTAVANWWLMVWRVVIGVVLSTSAAGCASLPSNVPREASTAFDAPERTTLGRLIQERRAQAGVRNESAFRLLDSEDAALASRLALIELAERSLDLQYYAIHADASTEVLLQRLRDAGRRGVRVRILLDDFNMVGKDAQVLRLAFEQNVQIRLFNPLPGSRRSLVGRLLTSLHDIPRIQKRMHNKLFIADSAMGITGGRNLGDAYFGSGQESNFVDLDVLAMGRIVQDMSASFDRYWNDELAYPMQALVSPAELEDLRKASDASAEGESSAGPLPPTSSSRTPTLTSSILPSVTPAAVANPLPKPMELRSVPLIWAPAALMVDKPGKVGPGDEDAEAGDTLVDGLLHLMAQARQEVLIVSPYFVPGTAMMDQFARMRANGVRIRVLTNSLASNDAPAAHAGYARYRRDLVDLGVELHEMRAEHHGRRAGTVGSRRALGSGPTAGGSKGDGSRASLHSKAVVIDQHLVVIGSMNLDLRSQLKNSEVALLIRSGALAREAKSHIVDTLAHSAYRLALDGDALVWRAPAGVPFTDERSEPGASARLKLLVKVIAPFAPDEML
jgi:cardiolipin synthase C